MKRAILATTALLGSTLSPLAMITPAQAANPTLVDMQNVCTAKYVAIQADPSKWRAAVIDAGSEDGPSTIITETERGINYRPDTNGSFVYANFLRAEDPLTRTGGSVNMWGQSVFGAKIYDNTLYDTEAQFEHTVTFMWSCQVEQLVNTPVWVEGHGNSGNSNGGSGNNGQNNGVNEQDGGNGQGNNGCGNGNGGSNPDGNPNDPPGCNGGGHYEDSWAWSSEGDFDESQEGDVVNEGYQSTGTDFSIAGQVAGVNYTENGSFRPEGVRSLACINPGKKGGEWTRKNGYTGSNCTTAYFNTAVTAYGNTFDTVSGSLPSSSLPAQ